MLKTVTVTTAAALFALSSLAIAADSAKATGAADDGIEIAWMRCRSQRLDQHFEIDGIARLQNVRLEPFDAEDPAQVTSQIPVLAL